MQDKGKNMKTYKWLLGAVVLLFLCWPFMAWAVVDAPDAGYVGDYANVLSDETEQYIIEQSARLDAATGAQIVIVTVDFLDGMTAEEYAYTIFNEWGIGDAEKDNGLLLLLAIGEEDYWAMQGKGLEGILSSGMLGDYLYAYLEPDFAAGAYDAGVKKVFDAFLAWYADYYQLDAQESTALAPNNTTVAEPVQKTNGKHAMAWIIILFIIVVVIISMNNRRKDRNRKSIQGRLAADLGRAQVQVGRCFPVFRGVSIYRRKIRHRSKAANQVLAAIALVALAAVAVAAVALVEAPAALAEAWAVPLVALKALAEAAAGAVEQVAVKY